MNAPIFFLLTNKRLDYTIRRKEVAHTIID